MTYQQALQVMKEKERLGILPGLDRIRALLAQMGNPQDRLRIIHVAGTNGKGSVAAMLSDALQRAGFTVGLYTSPYVVDYREQIRVNSAWISEEAFADYVARYQECEASEFEFLTAIMYRYFADLKVDYAIVECGLGGLEDATNTERSNLSVITSVSLDHTNLLGSTLEEIARQKAGIIRENSVCFLYPNPDCEAIFCDECTKKHTALVRVKEQGSHRQNNRALAQAVLDYLKLDVEVIPVPLPARQEKIGGVLLDGGHNLDAAKVLEPLLGSDEVVLLAMLRDKDITSYLSVLAPHCKRIITTQVDSPRALPADELAAMARAYCDDVTAITDPHEALQEASASGLTAVLGSFYLARAVRKDLSAPKL